MESEIILEETYSGLMKKVFYSVGDIKIEVGTVIKDVDGYFYFYFDDSKKGGWYAETLILIGNKVAELNKGWDEYISKNLNKEDET